MCADLQLWTLLLEAIRSKITDQHINEHSNWRLCGIAVIKFVCFLNKPTLLNHYALLPFHSLIPMHCLPLFMMFLFLEWHVWNASCYSNFLKVKEFEQTLDSHTGLFRT